MSTDIINICSSTIYDNLNLTNLINHYNISNNFITVNEERVDSELILSDVRLLNDKIKKNTKSLQGQKVAILTSSSHRLLVSILSAKEKNIEYILIHPDSSLVELKEKINDFAINVFLCDKEYIQIMNKLQWEHENFNLYICLDEVNVFKIEDTFNREMMKPTLWDYISRKAKNPIEGGGWYSSFTGKALTNEDIDDYLENTLHKLMPYMTVNTDILEIGCASGLTLNKIAPLVRSYDAIDISTSMVEKSKKLALLNGINNVSINRLAAHEIDLLDRKVYDLIILNSVCQYFPGYNYFRDILDKCMDKFRDSGIILIGDVMALESKDKMISDLIKFKNEVAQQNYHTKVDFSKELFYSKSFFSDIFAENPFIEDINILDKDLKINNELNSYRFDVILKINKNYTKPIGDKRKKQIGIKLSR